MNFQRLLPADVIVAVAAMVLLFVMALDWYSTAEGREARRIEKLSQPSGAMAGEVERNVQETARLAAEEAESNAWQAPATIDRVILAGLLATFVLAITAAFLRASARRFSSAFTPTALTALAAVLTAGALAYRAIQKPGLDEGATVESGVPLALIVLGVIALAARAAMREEQAGTAWREPQPETALPPAGRAQPPGPSTS